MASPAGEHQPDQAGRGERRRLTGCNRGMSAATSSPRPSRQRLGFWSKPTTWKTSFRSSRQWPWPRPSAQDRPFQSPAYFLLVGHAAEQDPQHPERNPGKDPIALPGQRAPPRATTRSTGVSTTEQAQLNQVQGLRLKATAPCRTPISERKETDAQAPRRGRVVHGLTRRGWRVPKDPHQDHHPVPAKTPSRNMIPQQKLPSTADAPRSPPRRPWLRASSTPQQGDDPHEQRACSRAGVAWVRMRAPSSLSPERSTPSMTGMASRGSI